MGRIIVSCCLFALLVLTAGIQWAFADNIKCLTCHSAPGFRKTTENGHVSLYVDADEFASTAHSSRDCLDCHVDFRGQRFPHKQKADPVQCTRCHHKGNGVGAPDISHIDGYVESVHGDAIHRGDSDAPTCASCHGTHGIRSPKDPKSTVYQTNVPETCGKCHFDSKMAKSHNLANISKYEKSVHARIIRKDRLLTAAVCTDCHGVHDILSSDEPKSTANRRRVPATCGKCHASVYKAYELSIHGKALARGVKDAPACTDCHGEHGIQPPSVRASSVYPTHVVATCSKCHEDAQIQHRYGLPANRLSTYVDSYHGIANKFGDITVANCATCHGAHNVLPSSDPKSPVSKKNLPHTCGKCHPGASKNFAEGTIHVFATKENDAIIYWVRLGYSTFVMLLIGSFCAYIVLDMIARWRGRLPWRRRG